MQEDQEEPPLTPRETPRGFRFLPNSASSQNSFGNHRIDVRSCSLSPARGAPEEMARRARKKGCKLGRTHGRHSSASELHPPIHSPPAVSAWRSTIPTSFPLAARKAHERLRDSSFPNCLIFPPPFAAKRLSACMSPYIRPTTASGTLRYSASNCSLVAGARKQPS